MGTEKVEITIRGRTLYVPSAEICGRSVVVTGNWLRRAAVRDEDLVQGEAFQDPQLFLDEVRRSALRADFFTFAQKIPETTPKYPYHFQWDNCAVVPLTSFEDWWEKRLPQETRKNVRRAARRGVSVKGACFDDDFVKGIQRIYNETPIRQGRRFWHFGKDFETIKQMSSTYLDRSEFLGAYLGGELIGFAKIIYVDRIATLMYILSKNEHQDKRPVNALLAKVVEVCAKKGISFLVYGKFIYDGNDNTLTEFKRRNGFEEVKFPRYFLPLTVRGRLAIRLGLHNGVKTLIPRPAVNLLRSLRSQLYRRRYSGSGSLSQTVNSLQ